MKKIISSTLALSVLMSGVSAIESQNITQAATSKTTYKIVEKKSILKYKTIKKTDPNLEEGKTRVTKGKNGYVIKVYKQKIQKGKVISSKYVKTKKTVKAKSKVIYVGTKKVVVPVDVKVTESTKHVDATKPSAPVEKYELNKIREKIEYQTIYQNDPTLLKGKQVVVQEGEDGIRENVFNERYIDGKLISTTPAFKTVIKEPVNKIVKIGTKEDPINSDRDLPSISSSEMNTSLGYNARFKDGRYDSDTIKTYQGFRNGQKTWNGYTVSEVNDKINSSFDQMKLLSPEERYEKSENISNYMVLTKGSERHFLGMKTNFKTQKMFNELKLYDLYLLNIEFLKLVNAERASLGIAPLKLDERLKQGNEIRAQEMANFGTISINGKAHSRPDGSWGTTAFEYMGKDLIPGEISWSGSFGGNFYKLTSEKALAEAAYEGWKSSKVGHHEAMINPNHKSVFFSMKIGEDATEYKNASGKQNILIGNAVFLTK